MWFKNTIYLFLTTFILFSCGESTKPVSTGPGSEIVVVCNKRLWDGPIGDSIRGVLTQFMQGLPDAEPEFSLRNIPEKDFNNILQAHRNVLIVDIKPANKISKVETLTNVWSDPQRVIKIYAGSDTAFLNMFAKHSEAIKELYNQSERASFRAKNSVHQNFKIEKFLTGQFGINMEIANDFMLVKKARDFIWLRADSSSNSIGLLIYTYSFKDTSQLNPANVIATRDAFAKRSMVGSSEGVYRTAGQEFFPTNSEKIIFKDLYAIETHGLWKTEGSPISGPFINYTIVDAPRRRIIVFDGYVNYPGQLKRNHIRQLESIIWGAEFGGPGKLK